MYLILYIICYTFATLFVVECVTVKKNKKLDKPQINDKLMGADMKKGL